MKNIGNIMKNIIAFYIAALGLVVTPALAKDIKGECVKVKANYENSVKI
jgi:hypothetical protein